MGFEKYQHVCKIGTDEVESLENGLCYIYPKLDGTNTPVWFENGEVKVGSRNRELTIDNDNHGACAVITNDPRIRAFFEKYPDLKLYGEFLVPHTIKTYEDDAWRKFYVFDVVDGEEDIGGITVPNYLHYEKYEPLLKEFNLDYIPLIAKIENPTYEQLLNYANENNYLVKEGLGEGIVIKRYDFMNRYGRRTWGKIVLNEFKQKKKIKKDNTEDGEVFEDEIVQAFLTQEFIEKEYAKIVVLQNGWRSEYIPRLLETVFKEFVGDYIKDILKKYKNPKIDFKRLKIYVSNRVKVVKPDLF